MPYSDRVKQRQFHVDWKAKRTEAIWKLKSGPCTDCGGFFHPVSMQFDHINDDKITNIAKLKTSSWDKILAEIAKCELVCANCHAVRSYNRARNSQPVVSAETL